LAAPFDQGGALKAGNGRGRSSDLASQLSLGEHSFFQRCEKPLIRLRDLDGTQVELGARSQEELAFISRTDGDGEP
jgi:hypothetical protein